MTRILLREYNKKRSLIKKRLKEFELMWAGSDKKIFRELCFCICTPQSKAVASDKAISELERKGTLFCGGIEEIREGLRGVRFPNNKAKYIVESRNLLTKNGALRVKEKIAANNIFSTREWLVKNIKGIGFKEASHFLRNIGFGKTLAILDVHILKNMVRLGVIRELPKHISPKKYMLLEESLRKFSKKINIPMDELDLLFWSMETGHIFK